MPALQQFRLHKHEETPTGPCKQRGAAYLIEQPHLRHILVEVIEPTGHGEDGNGDEEKV